MIQSFVDIIDVLGLTFTETFKVLKSLVFHIFSHEQWFKFDREAFEMIPQIQDYRNLLQDIISLRLGKDAWESRENILITPYFLDVGSLNLLS